MFKLIQIKGARTNVPEPTFYDIDGKTAYLAGAMYFIGEGKISNEPASDIDLRFIPLETVKANSGKTKICGYIVTENMVFETDIYNDLASAKIGNVLLGYTDSDGNIVGVDSESGYDAMLLDKTNAKNTNKVLVALKW